MYFSEPTGSEQIEMFDSPQSEEFQDYLDMRVRSAPVIGVNPLGEYLADSVFHPPFYSDSLAESRNQDLP